MGWAPACDVHSHSAVAESAGRATMTRTNAGRNWLALSMRMAEILRGDFEAVISAMHDRAVRSSSAVQCVRPIARGAGSPFDRACAISWKVVRHRRDFSALLRASRRQNRFAPRACGAVEAIG